MIGIILTVWIFFLPIAIINGLVREEFYKVSLGAHRSRQLSTIIAMALFIAVAYSVLYSTVSSMTITQLLSIGLWWVLLTIFFELVFGHYVEKLSWKKLLVDYNIFKGHLWVLFLATEAITPIVVYYLV